SPSTTTLLSLHDALPIYRDNVWIAGRGANGTTENQILKFDSRGTFLLQIGHRGRGTGSNDTANLGQPADVAVYAPTNEVFVADRSEEHTSELQSQSKLVC